DDLAQAFFLKTKDGLSGPPPAALSFGGFRPVRRHFGHLHYKYGDVVGAAPLLVKVGTDRLSAQDPRQASLLPGFLQGDLSRGLVGFHTPFRDDPAVAAASGGDEADSARPERDDCRLRNTVDRCRHRGVPASNKSMHSW